MKNNRGFYGLKYILLAYLCWSIGYPVLRLFSGIGGEQIRSVLSAVQFLPMLKNSVVTTLLATAVSVTLAFGLAFALYRSRIRFKSMWMVLFTVPMLVPSISHGMGLVLLLGDNGILTNLLGLKICLYGYKGIVAGAVLYSFPPAFLMFCDSFRYEDFTAYEAAGVLGLSPGRQFLTITLPSMRQTAVSAILAVFTMVFTDYGVPLVVGGTKMTLPVYMYREVIGMMNFSEGAVVGTILLMPAAVAFLLDLRKSRQSVGGSTVTKPYRISANRRRDAAVTVLLAAAFFLLCLPILTFISLGFVKQYPTDLQLTLDHVKKLLSSGMGMYLVNSLAVAFCTALVGTVLSYFSAYITARSDKTLLSQALHLISMLPLAIPGVVLGLAFVMSFHQFPWYSTVFILVMVNIAHFFSSPYLLAYNSLTAFSSSLEDASDSLGISRLRMLKDIYVPSTVPTIIEMYSCFFVNSMVTISAVSFLANFRTMTLALMIPQMESLSSLEGTALVSMVILLLNLAEKGAAFFARRYFLAHRG